MVGAPVRPHVAERHRNSRFVALGHRLGDRSLCGWLPRSNLLPVARHYLFGEPDETLITGIERPFELKSPNSFSDVARSQRSRDDIR